MRLLVERGLEERLSHRIVAAWEAHLRGGAVEIRTEPRAEGEEERVRLRVIAVPPSGHEAFDVGLLSLHLSRQVDLVL